MKIQNLKKVHLGSLLLPLGDMSHHSQRMPEAVGVGGTKPCTSMALPSSQSAVHEPWLSLFQYDV